ncbi:MAG: Hint domain-containing protein [Oligoflexus sp.]
MKPLIILLALFFPHITLASVVPDVIDNRGGFIEGTLVWTPWGPTEIQRLKKGDVVISYDLESGQIVETKVTDNHIFQESKVVELKAGGEVFLVNPDHRFYNPESANWIDAQDLIPGQDILLSKEHTHIKVESVREIWRNRWLYELTVEKNHNFFIGQEGLLAHNFAFVIPIGAWVIGQGWVWTSGALLAAGVTTAIILERNDGTPGCNAAQNKQFSDATRGLTKDEKRRVHDEISGCNLDYHEIKRIADEIKRGRGRK